MTPRDPIPTYPPQGPRGYWRQAHGYPMVYTTADGGTLCGTCATDAHARGDDSPQWRVIAAALACDYADAPVVCDHCARDLSADPEEEEADTLR